MSWNKGENDWDAQNSKDRLRFKVPCIYNKGEEEEAEEEEEKSDFAIEANQNISLES